MEVAIYSALVVVFAIVVTYLIRENRKMSREIEKHDYMLTKLWVKHNTKKAKKGDK